MSRSCAPGLFSPVADVNYTDPLDPFDILCCHSSFFGSSLARLPPAKSYVVGWARHGASYYSAFRPFLVGERRSRVTSS